jgi:phage tail-like protein
MPIAFGLTTAAGAAGKASSDGKPRNTGDVATSIRFHLKIDQQNIGWWNSFDGLGMETAVMQLEEGGNNSWVHQLPTRIKYSNVKLTRPINQDSGLVAVWFMAISKQVKRGTNAQIQAVDGDNKVIAQWSLMDVVPVRWTGPSFSVESPKVATETLELAFHGFKSPAGTKE